MFRSFFLNRRWMHWSVLGSLLILGATWYQVQLDVQINTWFGEFYDLIQTALAEPGTVALDAYFAKLLEFGTIAAIFISIAVVLRYFIRHYVFRWRTAMNSYYMNHWGSLRHIEGAAQRVQEDTMRFARITEGLGVSFMDAIMTLIAFLPILWTLSMHVTELPWIGPVEHSLVYVAIISAACGTALLALVGIKLPGLEFNNQRVEAAFRKELVFGEEYADRADPPTVKELFSNVRYNYFRLYLHYLYFDVARFSYLQFSIVLPYIMLGPTIVGGGITLGVLQQTIRAFGRVEASFQYLVNSWDTIVELISIYKRLRAFEAQIKDGAPLPEPAAP